MGENVRRFSNQALMSGKSIISVLLSILLLADSLAQGVDVDVCVIGAGPSGIQAAYSAEAKGLSVAVYEKNSAVGGKTTAVNVGNSQTPYFMAGVVHDGTKRSSIQDLLDKFDVQPIIPVNDIPESYHDDAKTVDYDLPYIKLILQGIKFVIKEIVFSFHSFGPDAFLSNYPRTLNLPLQDWLNLNWMSSYNELFWKYLGPYGYGHPSEIPAIYGLQYLQFSLESLGGVTAVYPFQQFLQRMADSPQGTVHLNVDITSVQYEADRNVLSYTQNGASRTANCGSTIIAFPQTAAAMTLFTPPDATGLSVLFAQVKTNNFYTLLVDDSEGKFGAGRSAKYHVPVPEIPDNPARNLLYFKQQDFPGSSVTIYYLTPSEKTDAQVIAESLENYSRLIGSTVDESKVQAFFRWIYFPHVSTQSLNDGFHHKLDAFQGQYNQYYVGALFNWEMVQDAMDHARFIVETRF